MRRWWRVGLLVLSGLALMGSMLYAEESTAIVSISPDPNLSFGLEGFVRVDEIKIDSSSMGKSEAQIKIRVENVSDAKIKMASYSASGTLLITALSPGLYEVEVIRRNYASIVRQVLVRTGFRYEIVVRLEAMLGRLELSGPAGTQWSLEGETLALDGRYIVGRYRLRGRLFGYEDLLLDVDVERKMRTRVEANFKPAPFRIANRGVDRGVFRPQNPGTLGTSSIRFSVTAHGSARLQISNALGEIVKTEKLDSFSTWDQVFFWNGRDAGGAVLANGLYSYTVVAEPEAGLPSEGILAFTGSLKIDDSLFAKYRSAQSGASGWRLAADTYTLPASSVQVGVDEQWNIGDADLGTFIGIRYGLIRSIELSLALDWQNGLGQSPRWDANLLAGIKWAAIAPKVEDGFSMAVDLNGRILLAHGQGSVDQEPGGTVRVTVPLQLRSGMLVVGLDPAVGMELQGRDFGERFLPLSSLWLGSRGAVALDGEGWYAAVSGRLWFCYDTAQWLEPEWQVALEGALNMPQSIIYVHAFVGIGARPAAQPSVNLGLGIGLIP